MRINNNYGMNYANSAVFRFKLSYWRLKNAAYLLKLIQYYLTWISWILKLLFDIGVITTMWLGQQIKTFGNVKAHPHLSIKQNRKCKRDGWPLERWTLVKAQTSQKSVLSTWNWTVQSALEGVSATVQSGENFVEYGDFIKLCETLKLQFDRRFISFGNNRNFASSVIILLTVFISKKPSLL